MGGKSNEFNKFVGFVGDSAFGGADKVKGYDMSNTVKKAEADAVKRAQDIATGNAPAISEMQLAQALQNANANAASLAASSRGINPALAFRAAEQMQQQNALQAGQEAAIQAEMEKRNANALIAQIAASQRGGAINQGALNQQAEQQYRKQTFDILSGIGQAGAKAAMG